MFEVFDHIAFEDALNGFLVFVQDRDPGRTPFEGFSHPFVRAYELDYKRSVLGRASAALRLDQWPRWIDSRPHRIFEAVLAACNPAVSNNLMEVKKGDRGNSAAALFLTAKGGSRAQKAAFGQALYSFFRGGGMEPDEVGPRMDELIAFVRGAALPQNWPLYGYLAWLMDPGRYAPVRPRTFDLALARFGSEARLSNDVRWEPYAAYTALVAWVRDRLGERYGPVDLIEAHSFLWIVTREVPLSPSNRGGVRAQVPDFAAELARRLKAAERREEVGLKGERAVYVRERDRLRAAGRRDLAERVRLVSAEHGATDDARTGYDVLSFETDGSERHIEVKSTTMSESSLAPFHLTEHERAVGERDPLWRVVRVWNVLGKPDTEDLGNVVVGVESWTLTPESWGVAPLVVDPTPGATSER